MNFDVVDVGSSAYLTSKKTSAWLVTQRLGLRWIASARMPLFCTLLRLADLMPPCIDGAGKRGVACWVIRTVVTAS